MEKTLEEWYDNESGNPYGAEPPVQTVQVAPPPEEGEPHDHDEKEEEKETSDEIKKIERQAEAKKAEMFAAAITSKLVAISSPGAEMNKDDLKKEVEGLIDKLKEVVKEL